MAEPAAGHLSVKTVIIGDSSVGKTCLLHRFTRDRFNVESSPTLGVEYVSTFADTPRGRRVELQLWDTAGQETFRTVTRGYYRSATVVYFVFDVAKRGSFAGLDRWRADFAEVAGSEFLAVLIANKTDLPEREIDAAEASQYAADNRMAYFECSAKTGANVADAFRSVLPDIDAWVDAGKISPPRVKDTIVYDRSPEEKNCC
jgi:small GTP-binding protein